MSKIGKNPVTIPSWVQVTYADNVVTVVGPKGTLTQDIHPSVSVVVEDDKVILATDHEDNWKFWGLSRALIANMIVGVTDGYEKKLLVIWVWYNAQVQGNKLVLSLWYSHKIEYDLPEGIQATCEQDQKWNAIIAIAGIHKQMVGQVAAEIRSFRKPEPYKGKWVRYFDEPVRIKPGKAAAK